MAQRLIGGLSELPHVTVFGPSTEDPMSGIVAWSIDGLAPQYVADTLFTDHDIVTTAGVHGSPPGARFLGVEGLIRAGIHCF
ncbi:aminotransferase class V-fold PLP-dependent enzyme, partial [Klebsiella pneumoniae]|uniref:aminotransferase class V-fold PLP-dependent enzyme n=1 Tax=Klebsiella pneumoniae TaxID=573 RepID=UPI0034D18800